MTVMVAGMDASTATVEELDPDAAYSVQVSATNGAGTSDLSPAVVTVPAEGSVSLIVLISDLDSWELGIVNGPDHQSCQLKLPHFVGLVV